jgi:hypothetical protein
MGTGAVSRRVMLAVVLAVGGLAAYEVLRAAWIGAQLGNEDGSLLWVAAREWVKGRIHQPNFYGQSYGSTLEAIPIAVLHSLRITYWTSTALVLAGIEWLSWAALASAAWYRRHRVLAIVAIATPVILGAYHAIFVTMVPDAPGPRLAVVLGAALLIALPTSERILSVAVLLLALGLQLDLGSALLGIPVLAWFGLTHLWTRRQFNTVLLGLVAPVALFVYTRLFYARHPDYAFHDPTSLRTSTTTLGRSVDHLGSFLGLYTPEVLRWWLLPLIVFASLLVALLSTRQRAYVVPAALAGLIGVYALATPKAQETLGPLFPSGRILLALPATIWFLCFLATEAGVLDGLRSRIGTRVIVAAICIVCIASSALRLVDYGSREGYWRAKAVALRQSGKYGFDLRANVLRECDAEISLARRYQVELIVSSDLLVTYACAAQASAGLETLTLGYERRTWRLYAEYGHPRSRLIWSHAPARLCELARQRGSCSWVNGDAILAFAPQPSLPLLSSLGFTVRAFGPRCHPVVVPFGVVCGGRSIDLRRHPFAPPPADQERARTAIASAYATMFKVTPDGSMLAPVENRQRFEQVLRQLGADPVVATAPTVVGVSFLDDHEAVVQFRLGQTMHEGEAVIQDREWRVAEPTFCTVTTGFLFEALKVRRTTPASSPLEHLASACSK